MGLTVTLDCAGLPIDSSMRSEETQPRKRKRDIVAAETNAPQKDQPSQDHLDYDGPGDTRREHDGAACLDGLESRSEYVAGEYTNEEFYFPGTQPIRTIKVYVASV